MNISPIMNSVAVKAGVSMAIRISLLTIVSLYFLLKYFTLKSFPGTNHSLYFRFSLFSRVLTGFMITTVSLECF